MVTKVEPCVTPRRRAGVGLLAAGVLLSLGCARGAVHAGPGASPAPAPAAPGVTSTWPAPAAPAGGAAPADGTRRNAARVPALLARIPAGTLVERFVAASALFLGAAYQDGPLGEGDAGGPDPDPRVDFDRADCVTYLEQSLALALCAGGDSAAAPDAFLRALDRIRYRDGEVAFAARNHYMERDWASANAWLVEDVTERTAPGGTVELTRTIDRAQFLREKGAEPRPGVDDAAPLSMRAVPRESAGAVAPAIRSGDLIFWTGRKDGIDVVHTGLAVRDASGALLFRHASSTAGKVTEQPFADYAAHATFASGFLVLRLREDAR
jgi:hypothetical protein